MRDLMQHSSRTFAAEMMIGESVATKARDSKAFTVSIENNLRSLIEEAVAKKCIGCQHSNAQKEDRNDILANAVRVRMSIRCEYRGSVCAIYDTARGSARGAAFDTIIMDEFANMTGVGNVPNYFGDLVNISAIAEKPKPRSKDAPISETAGEW